MKRPIVIFILSALFPGPLFGQDERSIKEQAEEVAALMGGWFAARNPRNIAVMNEQERQIMIRYYRDALEKLNEHGGEEIVNGWRRMEYRKELLKWGDADALAEAVKVVLEADLDDPRFGKAYTDLMDAARPEAIPLLAPRIFVDEPNIGVSFGDAGGYSAKSYGFASGFLRTMERSPAFSDEVRWWAKYHFGADSEGLLQVMRGWWKENEAAFQAGDYKAVRPGRDIRTAELEASKAQQALRQAYADGLRAQGKDTTDPKNWEGYRILRPGEAAAPLPQTTPAPTTPALLSPPTASDPLGFGFIFLGGLALLLAAGLWAFFKGR